MMTAIIDREQDVRNAIVAQLRARNLTRFWVDRWSQILDVGSSVFVELIVNDGSKLQQFEEVVAAVKAEYQGLEIDSIVRAVWAVDSVRHFGGSYDRGVLRSANTFEAILKSGSTATTVQIDVTGDAFDQLKEQINKEGRTISDAEMFEFVGEKVREFLVLQLSLGGTSYWDPLRYNRRMIHGPMMAYIAQHSAPYRQLESAINYTFDQWEDNLLLPDFLKNLSNSAISIHSTEDALQLLPPEAFGAAYTGAEVLENASGGYKKLSRDERVLIKAHFKSRVDELERLQPEIISTFPKAFCN